MWSPTAQCIRCKAFCSANQHLIGIPPGTQVSDDYERFDTLCERCYCAVVTRGRARWDRAMQPLWLCDCREQVVTYSDLSEGTYGGTCFCPPCTCIWSTENPFRLGRELVGEPCDVCFDRMWFVSNLKLALRSLRMAKPWSKSVVSLRAYNRWGRLVGWWA